MQPPTDEQGYLLRGQPLAIDTALADGTKCTFVQREFLETALRSFGEDALAGAVRAGISAEQVRALGIAASRLICTADPRSKVRAGHPIDRAVAAGAVEVLEGEERPLARKRRRSTPT